MKINPFSIIYDNNNELRLSLYDKIKDTFNVFTGEYMERLGLFDYLTFGVFILSSSILSSASNLMSESNLIKMIFFIPAIIVAALLTGISFPLRYLTSGILTLISMPIVILTHIILTKIKQADIKEKIDDYIEENVKHDKNSLSITVPTDSHAWLEIIIEQLAHVLNDNPTITQLTINNNNFDSDWLEQLIVRLKYVTELSAPYKICNAQMLATLRQSNLTQLHTQEINNVNALGNFLTVNQKLELLTTQCSFDLASSDDLLKGFNNTIKKVGIQYPCKLKALNETESFTEINSIMDKIIDAHAILRSCFELYKIWRIDNNEQPEPINKDILRCFIMALLTVLPEGIEENQKGLIRALYSNRFFSKKMPQLITLDSQEQSNHITIDINLERSQGVQRDSMHIFRAHRNYSTLSSIKRLV